jgi:hypothetical protein
VKEAQPTVLLVCYGANEANAGEEGLARFVEGYQDLLDALADTKVRLILVAPPPRARPSARLPDPAKYNAVLGRYAETIGKIAQQRKAHFLDLAQLVRAGEDRPDQPYGPDGIQLSPSGNAWCAQLIAEALGIPSPATRLPETQLATLRDLIRQKNEFYFHRHRPQNETYLLLFRKREQGNNAVEIPQFDPLIADLERQIAELLKR